MGVSEWMAFLPLIVYGSKTTDLLSFTYLERDVTILNAHRLYLVFWADHTGGELGCKVSTAWNYIGVFVVWRHKSQ